MDPFIVGLIGIAILIVLLFSGLSIGVGMALAGFVGFAVIVGIGPALGLLKSVPYNTFAQYDLSVIPLFILMGSFALAAGMSEDLFNAVYKWIGLFSRWSSPGHDRCMRLFRGRQRFKPRDRCYTWGCRLA